MYGSITQSAKTATGAAASNVGNNGVVRNEIISKVHCSVLSMVGFYVETDIPFRPQFHFSKQPHLLFFFDAIFEFDICDFGVAEFLASGSPALDAVQVCEAEFCGCACLFLE